MASALFKLDSDMFNGESLAIWFVNKRQIYYFFRKEKLKTCGGC